MNDLALKLAMARLLPDKIKIYHDTHCSWKELDEYNEEPDVLETEWLYVMHLIEQTLNPAQLVKYVDYIYGQVSTYHCDCSATFNQRATAMCKLKGIKL